MQYIFNRWQGCTLAVCDCKFYLLRWAAKGQSEILADECVRNAEMLEAAHRERSKNGSKDQP